MNTVPLALIVLIVAIVLTAKRKEWGIGAWALIAGLLLAATPWGSKLVTFITEASNWVSQLFGKG